MKVCAVCKKEIVSGESHSVINGNTYYHMNGFCDSIVLEKLIDGEGGEKQLNESLNDLSDYEIL